MSAARPPLAAALTALAALGLADCRPAAPARRDAAALAAMRARDARRIARAAPRATAPTDDDRALPPVPEAPDADGELAAPVGFTLANGLRVAVLRRPGPRPVAVAFACGRCGVESPDQPVGVAAAALRLVRVGWSFGGDPRECGRYLDHGEAALLAVVDAARLPAALDGLLRALHPHDLLAPWFRRDGELVDRFEGHDTDDALRAMLFGRGHTLSRPLAGAAEEWGRVSFADAQSFVLRRYGPSQSALALVGDVDPERLRAELEARFRPWPARELGPVVTHPPRFNVAGPVATVVSSGPSPLVSVALALPVFEPGEGSSAALAVFHELLQGYTGTLLRVLRTERGAAYTAQAALEDDRDVSWVEVTAQLRAASFEPALGALLAEFERLRAQGPAEAEFERARRAAVEAELAGRRANPALSLRLVNLALAGADLGLVGSRLARLRAVTREDVARVAAAALRRDRMALWAYGPGAAAAWSLQRLGFRLVRPEDVM